jgi:hypothetical protein
LWIYHISIFNIVPYHSHKMNTYYVHTR